MKKALKTISMVVGVLTLLFALGLGMLLFGAMLLGMGSKSPNNAILTLDLSRSIPDSSPEPTPLEALGALSSTDHGAALPLSVITRALDHAAGDKNIAGLFLTGQVQRDGVASGPAALKELKAAIDRFKASGKPVLAYNVSWSKQSLYLASGASTLYVHPMGAVDVSGLVSEGMYFADAFKKYGVEVQVTRVGKYKSAVEPFINNHRSDADREQTQAYLDDLWGEWRSSVAADRKITPEALQALADEKGDLVASEALEAKLVDTVAPYDEVLLALRALTKIDEKTKELPQTSVGEYSGTFSSTPSGSKVVAVIFAEGEIVEGEGGAHSVGGKKLARELRKLRLDDDVKAVVLRVNSPGGSVTASDEIQREVILTNQKKPLVVSMGSLAASGGYWISTHASRVLAEPNTLTGSIGVFGFLPNLQKLFNEHGITFDEVQTSKLGSIYTLARPKNEAELARVQHTVDQIYDRFIEKVAEGRKLDPAAVREIAQGRVWSGKQALALHLVDELGGFDRAIEVAAGLAKIETDYRVQGLPSAKPNFSELFAHLGDEGHPMGGQLLPAAGPLTGGLRSVALELSALQQLNDPVGAYARIEPSILPW